jgi:DNA-binding NtrC family response regulator
MIGSFLAYVVPRRVVLPSRIPVVALIVDEQDRHILAKASSSNASGHQTWEVHFAESCEQVSALASRLVAPIILLDRDWPGMEWRTAVQGFAALTHHACVVLVSGVDDAYLWEELVRSGGYDILPKPIEADDVSRVMKLALPYWAIHAPGRSPLAASLLRK